MSGAILAAKRKESGRQVRDTVRRIREALLGTGARLDREAWRARSIHPVKAVLVQV